MQLTSFLQEGRLTVALVGEIDHHRAKAFMHAVSSKIEAYRPSVCVLDFQEVSFVDSSAIAVVIHALREMNEIEGELFVSGLHTQPLKVFRMAGMDKLVEMEEQIS